MNSKRSGPTKLVVLAAAAMFIAAACGGSSATASPSAVATAAPTAAPSVAASVAASAEPSAAANPNADSVYSPLAKAPCDVSGKDIYFLSVLKGHPTLRLWSNPFAPLVTNYRRRWPTSLTTVLQRARKAFG